MGKVMFKFSQALNYAPRIADVWHAGGMAPCVPKLITRYGSVVSFKFLGLYPQLKNRESVGPRVRQDAVAKKIIMPCRESNPGHAEHSPATALTEIPPAQNYGQDVKKTIRI
jgi:hypothetical protein